MNQLFYSDGTPYPEGAKYHIHPDKGPMEGAFHSEIPHAYLTFTKPDSDEGSDTPNPTTSAQAQSNNQGGGYSGGGSGGGGGY